MTYEMNPFLKYMRALVIITLLKLIKLTSEQCIGTDTTISKECSYCSADFYRSSIFKIDSGTFQISDCVARASGVYEKTFYISNGGCGSSSCLGTLESPFPNIITGFFFASGEANKYKKAKLKFLLIGETHYIFESHLKNDKGVLFFRRTLADIELSPEKIGDVAKVIIKTDEFHLFVSGSLRIQNINFIGSDLAVRSPSCKEQASICCADANLQASSTSDVCGLKGVSVPSQGSTISPGRQKTY